MRYIRILKLNDILFKINLLKKLERELEVSDISTLDFKEQCKKDGRYKKTITFEDKNIFLKVFSNDKKKGKPKKVKEVTFLNDEDNYVVWLKKLLSGYQKIFACCNSKNRTQISGVRINHKKVDKATLETYDTLVENFINVNKQKYKNIKIDMNRFLWFSS